MLRRNKLFGAVLLAAATIVPAGAYAQYDPSGSAMLGAGMGDLAISSSILSATRALSKQTDDSGKESSSSQRPAKAVNAPANTPADQAAAMERAKAKLLPEYQRRLARDGRDSANAWLKEAAYAEGVAAGRAARAQQAD